MEMACQILSLHLPSSHSPRREPLTLACQTSLPPPSLTTNSNRFSVPLPMDSQGSFSSPHPQLASLDNPTHFDSSSNTASPYPSFTSFPSQPLSIYSPSPSFSNQIPLNVNHPSSASLRDNSLDLSLQQILPLGGHISAGSDPLHSSQSSLSESVHTIDYCPNPVVTGSHTMPLQPSTSSVVPQSVPSLPHDLDFVMDLGIRMEDYLGETVNGSPSTVQRLQNKPVGGVSVAATGEVEARAKKEPRKRSRSQQKGNPSKLIAGSPGCLSPLSTSVNKLPSSLVVNTRHHSLPPPNQHLEAVISSPPLSVPAATTSQSSATKPMAGGTTTCSGNASDTSSGVSSAGTKLSSSSSHSSPSPSSSAAASGSNSPVREEKDSGGIIPVPEPNSGLGDKKEYMRQSPLLPPSPPLADVSIDLHPEVPLYEVG